MRDLITPLRSDKILLMDGAMGTELQRLTQTSSSQASERFNLTDPELVRSIHRAYLDAGAQVILTNTFQANPPALADQHHAVWDAAVQIAREAAADRAFVLADVGPIDGLTDEIARAIVDECRHTDGILLETWSSLDALHQFAQALSAEPMPLLVSFTFHRDTATHELQTFTGFRPEACAHAAIACGVAALGANCAKEIGMEDMAELAGRYRAACDLPIFIRPNAGTPVGVDSAWTYPHTAAAMASALPKLLEAGVTMIGGCCGTTPEYIRAFRDAIDRWQMGKRPG